MYIFPKIYLQHCLCLLVLAVGAIPYMLAAGMCSTCAIHMSAHVLAVCNNNYRSNPPLTIENLAHQH